VLGRRCRCQRRERCEITGTARFGATGRDERAPVGMRERAQRFA
jgi:hypothetical protein